MTQLSKIGYCEACPAFKTGQGRCSPFGAPVCDVYVLGGAPKESEVQGNYVAFSGESGDVYKAIMTSVKKTNPAFMTLRTKMHHAAHCYEPDMKTETIHHCASLVTNEIYNSKAKVIMALGAEAMKALGLKGTVGETRGQELYVTIGDRDIPVIVSFAPGALMRKENAGQLPTAKHDIRMAMNVAAFGKRQHLSIAEMTKDYKMCKTPAEFKALVDMVLTQPADKPDGTLGPAEQNLLALDTETAVIGNKYSAINTWVPGFKMIALSVSWAPGKSAAVLLNHKLNPHPFEEYEEDIKRLLLSPNPKTFHNWKYDCKVLELAYTFYVNNVLFDSQMGEYLLDENKAGEYGLKKITKNRVPDFFGYEKMLKGTESEAKRIIEESREAVTSNSLMLKDLKTDAAMYRERITNINDKKKTLSKKIDAVELGELEFRKTQANTMLMEVREKIAAVTQNNRNAKTAIIDATAVLAENKGMSFEDMDVDTMMLYASIDTDICRQISKQQIAEMKKDSMALFKVLTKVMLPAARVLAELEHVGIKVDLKYLAELKIHFEKIIEENKAKVFEKIGKEINLNSAKAIIDVLTAQYGVKLTKKTKNGQYSTDSSVMEELAKEYAIAGLILDYKKAYKARHTFLNGIMLGGKSKHDYGCSIDGRIHANYNQTVAATGRLSSSAPNMQNVPLFILDKNIKKLFIPDNPPDNPETNVIVQLDASAAEVRVMTAYAPDPELIKVLNAGLDTHSFVGSEVFASKGIFDSPGVTYAELKNREDLKDTNPKEFLRLDTMRQIAKMVMFLTIYGGGAYTLQSNLEKAGTILTIEQCEDIISMLLKKFPAISKYMRTIKNTVNKTGEVQTYFGRKRRFPIARFSFKMRKAAYREAINSPIQGTSSDILLHQMTELHGVLRDLGYKRILRGTVHDSVFFQFPKADLHLLVPLLDVHFRDNVNVHFPWMKVKFEYDVEFGPSYGEAKINLKKYDFKKTA